MTRIAWMTAGCVASWLALSVIVGREVFVDLGLGMAGPLVAAAASWMMIERTYRRNFSRVTPLMFQLLGAKMVFFAVYVIVCLRGLSLHPVPFAASLAAYFISLHIVEAVWLQRLFASAQTAPAAR